MRNNRGQMSVMAVILGVFLIVGIAAGGFYLVGQSGVGGDKTNTNVLNCADSTGTLTLTGINALKQGTTVSSPSITCGVDGGSVATSVTSGTTTFPIGAELNCLVSKSGYIDTTYTNTMACGGLQDNVEMFESTSDNPSIEIQDKNSNTLTDNVAGGATNITDLSAGEVMKAKVIFTGTALESSGDGIYVIEFPANSNPNITSDNTGVTLGNLGRTGVPKVHTIQNAGSRVDAFEVPAVVGSSEATYNLQVSLQASKDLSGGVYTDWYAKQDFIDTDGTIKTGVEDSQGTLKYENTLDYDFFINAA